MLNLKLNPMKTKVKLLALGLFAAFITSCAPQTYFQVYKASPTHEMEANSASLVYEDDHCMVFYNLWADGGNMGFRFYNKTDQNIYLYLDQSFFVINGMAHDYYKNRVFTNSSNLASSVTRSGVASASLSGITALGLLQTNSLTTAKSAVASTSSGSAVSYHEAPVVCIPSKTSKIFVEYSINNVPYRSCDLFRYPNRKQISTQTFTKEDSPFVFSNRLLYTVGEGSVPIGFTNEFYVTEITNLPEREMFDAHNEEFCGQKSMTPTRVYTKVSPARFFIQYTKGGDIWKH